MTQETPLWGLYFFHFKRSFTMTPRPIALLKRSPLKYGRCCSCNETIRPGQDRLIIDESKIDGKKNATYCMGCENVASKNNTYPGVLCRINGILHTVTKNLSYEKVSFGE